MDDAFKIYIEQLRKGQIEKINESFSPEFMDLHEPELSFNDPIMVKGQAYLAEDNLVLNFSIHTAVILLCSICNAPVKIDIHIEAGYHVEPEANISNGVYNFKEVLREMILLETPAFAECEGKCPRRKEIARYLKKPADNQLGSEEEEGYHPFADLDWDPKKTDNNIN